MELLQLLRGAVRENVRTAASGSLAPVMASSLKPGSWESAPARRKTTPAHFAYPTTPSSETVRDLTASARCLGDNAVVAVITEEERTLMVR